MRIFKFLVSKVFWINLLLIIVLVVLLVGGSLYYLDSYTRHGKSVSVPDLTGLTVDEVSQVLSERDLLYEITDSIYSDELPRGNVVTQNPDPGKEVKKSRVVFLTVNSQLPEMVQMPDLIGKSRRIALAILGISGIVVDKLEYEPDESCTDCVLKQLYEGEPIAANEKIRKGEKVTLVLGKEGYANTLVPGIVGLTYTEALEILNNNSLNTGLILTCEDCTTSEDSLRAIVTRQIPPENSRVSFGSGIDVYLSTNPDDLNELMAVPDSL